MVSRQRSTKKCNDAYMNVSLKNEYYHAYLCLHWKAWALGITCNEEQIVSLFIEPYKQWERTFTIYMAIQTTLAILQYAE